MEMSSFCPPFSSSSFSCLFLSLSNNGHMVDSNSKRAAQKERNSTLKRTTGDSKQKQKDPENICLKGDSRLEA